MVFWAWTDSQDLCSILFYHYGGDDYAEKQIINSLENGEGLIIGSTPSPLEVPQNTVRCRMTGEGPLPGIRPFP